ncbi:MAG: DUF559 domain-containing protein [Solirubrobacteraceae bacterium]
MAWRQLRGLGWSRRMIEQQARQQGWRTIHRGVYALFRAPLTQRQVWIAAVLTAPDTFLAGATATGCWGFHEAPAQVVTVVRPGSGGPRRTGSLLVARSTTLEGQTTRRDGIPIVTAERALVDVAAGLKRQQLGRAFRESIRLKTTTANQISKVLAGQRGTAVLVDLCDRYATIPYHRCRSDAESRALEVLHDAGVMAPKVNVRVGGCEADLVWRERKLIVEIDGDQFHRFADEDARKEAAWRGVGYTVRRVPSDDVYYQPHHLLAQVNVPDATR